jgi:hypothetical protein
MTITINNGLIVVCIFYFFLSAFLSYLFRQSNIFLKLVVFFFIIGLFVGIESVNRLEVTIASVLGFLFIYTDTALDFLFGVKLGIETVFFGFFAMLRQVLRFIFLPIANCFTWFYNVLSRFFGWNLKFHRLGEPRPKDHKTSSHRSDRRPRRHWRDKGDSPRREESRDNRDSDRDRKSGHSSTHRHSSRPSGNYKPRSNDDKSQDSKDDKPQNTRPKYTSSADKQKQDSINRAKEEVRQAREQSKRKEEQRQGNTGNSGGDNTKANSNVDNRSHQQILGLSDNFTLAELSKAYKIGLARYHPDKYSHMSADFQKEAQDEFIKVKNAYNTLLKGFN